MLTVKNMFKRPKHDATAKSSKSKSHAQSASEPNLSAQVNLRKLMDKQLLQRYRQTVEQRVEMMRTRAFPDEVLPRLADYRADMS